MKSKRGYAAAMGVLIAGLAFAASGTAHADNVNPYPPEPMRNLQTGVCIDSNYVDGQAPTPAYDTDCNPNVPNQGWITEVVDQYGDAQISEGEESGCLQAVPSTRSVVVAACNSSNIDQLWAVYTWGSVVAIWSEDLNACGYTCTLGDSGGLELDSNQVKGTWPSYELWSPPQKGGQ